MPISLARSSRSPVLVASSRPCPSARSTRSSPSLLYYTAWLPLTYTVHSPLYISYLSTSILVARLNIYVCVNKYIISIYIYITFTLACFSVIRINLRQFFSSSILIYYFFLFSLFSIGLLYFYLLCVFVCIEFYFVESGNN